MNWSNSGCVSAVRVHGLHMMAEENALLRAVIFLPDLGDMWRNVCPKSPGVEQLRSDKRGSVLASSFMSTMLRSWLLKSSAGQVKQCGGAVSQGLGAWEGGLELSHDHGPSLS